MKKKCCLNCAYLHKFDREDRVTWSVEDRRNDSIEWLGPDAFCFHEQWTRQEPDSLERTLADGMERQTRNEKTGKIWVQDRNRNWICLDKERECDFHFRFSPKSSMPLDRIWQEHQQQRQEDKYRCRFWITASIGGITALAVIASAVFHWLEWKGGE